MALSSSLFFSTALSSSLSSSSLPGLLRLRSHKTQLDPHCLRPPGSLQSPAEGCPEPESSNGTVAHKRKMRKTRKPRPSFYEQTIERWSLRIDSQREKLPWQVEREGDDVRGVLEGGGGGGGGNDVKGARFGLGNRGTQPPWAHGGRTGDTHLDSGSRTQITSKKVEYEGRNGDGRCLLEQRTSNNEDEVVTGSVPVVYPQEKGANSTLWVRGSKSRSTLLNAEAETRKGLKRSEFGGHGEERVGKGTLESGSYDSNAATPFSCASNKDKSIAVGKADVFRQENRASTPVSLETKMRNTQLKFELDKRQVPSRRPGMNDEAENEIVEKFKSSFDQRRSNSNSANEEESASGTRSLMHNVDLPWKSEDGQGERKVLRERSNTELAEKTIPEPDLQRLRNVALRMKERTKVGSAGVTEALVQAIREKWKEAEVVKLKFEGPPAINMKRTHEILESKTGGIVIWRSGSSLVLYRGMNYKLPCVKSYSEHVDSMHTLFHLSNSIGIYNKAVKAKDSLKYEKSSQPDLKAPCVETSHGCTDASDIDGFLDELGPCFMDWCGSKPLPVDADALPSLVPGYKPPLRLLPFRVKTALRNKEMTYLRRLARTMPPHFALGRNRNNQGLAKAMVKLWEKSIIAKIAIKRGVPNTCNDRMAEELKALTGGVLLSRNKEFIVFYRGNNFLTPSIAEVVAERENLADIRQDEEEQARQMASEFLVSNTKLPGIRHLAGTLAETLEAKAHWADEPSKEDREQVMKDTALAKHASLIRFMEKKLRIAKEKVKKAEQALAKVQEFLDPAELPTDLETVTDEERFLFRRIGLKMRGFLSLGRRGVFDGTIENMHLNWKHRELVKIIVKGKSFAQVKQVAISLEAESGGVLISLDKTTKGYVIVVYRGKNYLRPHVLRPKNLLTKRQALERSIELQRREALKHHISNLLGKIEMMKSELEQMEKQGITDESAYVEMNDVFYSYHDDNIEEEGEEAYLKTYDMGDEEEEEDHDASS